MKKDKYRTGSKPTLNEAYKNAENFSPERFVDEIAEQMGKSREEILIMMKEFGKKLEEIKKNKPNS